VNVIAGEPLDAGAIWGPPKIRPDGTFDDFLSANGNPPTLAVQTFTAGGSALGVNIGGGGSFLINSYSKTNVTVNGTQSPRPCVKGSKDPW
jgi:hypothetical protein